LVIRLYNVSRNLSKLIQETMGGSLNRE